MRSTTIIRDADSRLAADTTGPWLGRKSTRNPIHFRLALFPAPARLALALLLVTASGCRSRVVQVTLINSSAQPLSNIIVDYPDATFGKNSLAPGEAYHYVIKPVEKGPLTIQFTNAQGAGHSFSGPIVGKDQEGSIAIHLTQDAMTANPSLK